MISKSDLIKSSEHKVIGADNKEIAVDETTLYGLQIKVNRLEALVYGLMSALEKPEVKDEKSA